MFFSSICPDRAASLQCAKNDSACAILLFNNNTVEHGVTNESLWTVVKFIEKEVNREMRYGCLS